MSILDSITTPKPTPRPLTWIIFGEPKTGKTTLAATFPDPLLVDIEGGAEFIECPQFPLRRIVAEGKGAHAALGELYKAMREGAHGYKTVIFDTADELWNILAKPHKKDGKVPLSQYQMLYEQYLGILESFRLLGLDVVLTSHVKHDTDEDQHPVSTDIKLPGQLQAQVAAKVDEILYLTMKRTKRDEQGEDNAANSQQTRVLVCKPTDHPKLGLIKAGDRSGRLPDMIYSPTFADLECAKLPKPGLFDGMGDPQDDAPITAQPDAPTDYAQDRDPETGEMFPADLPQGEPKRRAK